MPIHFEFEAIGTRWFIDVHHEISDESKSSLLSEIISRISQFESTYSRFKPDSFISVVSKNPGVYKLPDDAFDLLEIYSTFYKITDGAFTPLIGQVLENAGYDPTYSLVHKKELIPPPRLNEVLSYDKTSLTIKKVTRLDVGSSGKGYIIDLIARYLKSCGFNKYTVDAGRDIYFASGLKPKTPLRVGLENPTDVKQVIGIANLLPNNSICCSAGSRRKWGKFHHIINPHTLSSPTEVLSTWVIAEKTVISDTIATCLFFTKPEKILDYFKFEYLMLYPDFSIKKSQGFDAEIFYKQ